MNEVIKGTLSGIIGASIVGVLFFVVNFVLAQRAIGDREIGLLEAEKKTLKAKVGQLQTTLNEIELDRPWFSMRSAKITRFPSAELDTRIESSFVNKGFHRPTDIEIGVFAQRSDYSKPALITKRQMTSDLDVMQNIVEDRLLDGPFFLMQQIGYTDLHTKKRYSQRFIAYWKGTTNDNLSVPFVEEARKIEDYIKKTDPQFISD